MTTFKLRPAWQATVSGMFPRDLWRPAIISDSEIFPFEAAVLVTPHPGALGVSGLPHYGPGRQRLPLYGLASDPLRDLCTTLTRPANPTYLGRIRPTATPREKSFMRSVFVRKRLRLAAEVL